jgi:hypothetical protein
VPRDAGGRRSRSSVRGRLRHRPTAAMAAARSWDTRLDAILLEIPQVSQGSWYPTVCSSAGARPRRLSCEWSSRHGGLHVGSVAIDAARSSADGVGRRELRFDASLTFRCSYGLDRS